MRHKPPDMPQVAVFVKDRLSLDVYAGPYEFRNYVLDFKEISDAISAGLQRWNISILPYTLLLSIEKAYHPMTGNFLRYSAPRNELLLLDKQVTMALQQGQSICVLAGTLASDLYPIDSDVRLSDVYSDLTNNGKEPSEYIIGHRILRRFGFMPKFADRDTSEYKVKRGEFEKYLDNFAAGSVWVHGPSDSPEDIICFDDHGEVAGFCLPVARGNLFFLPYLQTERLDFRNAMTTLVSAIFTYLSKVAIEEPDWVKDFVFHSERPLLERKLELEREISALDSKLSHFQSLRSLLWQRDYALQRSVPNLFQQLGIETRQDEVYEEDFWLTAGTEDKAIAEVKSGNGNVTRQDIGQLDSHRKARQKGDDFPALLVKNTFAKVQNIKDKDKRVEPNVCQRAIDDNVLIMRTLDLVRLYDLVSQGQLQQSELTHVVLTESGWLRVDARGYEVVRE